MLCLSPVRSSFVENAANLFPTSVPSSWYTSLVLYAMAINLVRRRAPRDFGVEGRRKRASDDESWHFSIYNLNSRIGVENAIIIDEQSAHFELF